MVKTKKSNYAEVPVQKKLDTRLAVKGKSGSCAFRRGLAANEKNLRDGLKSIEDLVQVLQTSKPVLVSSQICSICAFNFNNQERLPICLPCGHTVCKVCVYSLKHSPLTGVCPYDRKEYFFIQELLPINISLLYTENIEESRACSVHGYELVAFCTEHEAVLCGKCLISHLTHKFIDVDSDQAQEVASQRAVFFDLVSKKIEDFFTTWKNFYCQLREVKDNPAKGFGFVPKALGQLLCKSFSHEAYSKLAQSPELLGKLQTLKQSFLASSPLARLKAAFPELDLHQPDSAFLASLCSTSV